MTGLSSTVISNLAYVVGALVLAIILGIAVWWRHRQPKSVDANVASFKRGLMALSPENRPAGARIVTSGAGRGPNGAGGTEPMHFTSIKLERVPEPSSEPDSVESPEDEATESPEDEETAVAGEIDEAGQPGGGGLDTAPPDVDDHGAGEHEAAQGEAAAGDAEAAPPGGALSGEAAAGDQGVAAPSVIEEGVGQHHVQEDGVLMGDDNSPAAEEASGHPAGGDSG